MTLFLFYFLSKNHFLFLSCVKVALVFIFHNKYHAAVIRGGVSERKEQFKNFGFDFSRVQAAKFGFSQ